MFVRFRQTGRRLQCSLIETRRQGAKVHHDHIASLGSVPLTPSPADRLAFWTNLHQRLDALSNRLDAAQRGAILTAIHVRIPMPTLDDQQAVQVERAQADVRFWDVLAVASAEQIDGQKAVLKSVQRSIAHGEQVATDTAEEARAAKERLARVEQGEIVSGIVGKPLTRKDLLKITGMSEAQLRDCELLADFPREDIRSLLMPVIHAETDRAWRSAIRQLHRALYSQE